MATTHRSSQKNHIKISSSIAVVVCAVAVVLLTTSATILSFQVEPTENNDLESRSLATQGIVVPKRTALIVGLNQQFKKQSPSNSSILSVPSSLHWPLSRLQPRRPNSGNNHPAITPFVSAAGSQQPAVIATASSANPQQGLYLDRHQQEILAANPNLLNPSSLPSALLTRSAADPQHHHHHSSTNSLAQQQQQQQLQLIQQQQQYLLRNDSQRQTTAATTTNGDNSENSAQQLYRGYSLIELDVKSEADRRFIQDLYGNLSAALNEQAQNPHALTVSPYVDVDFWSFRQALNDQIDIMVSPKSRSFILGQLNRAKIRHRIKIDDIQARLDQQQQPTGFAAAAASGFSHQHQSSDSPLSGRAGLPTLLDKPQTTSSSTAGAANSASASASASASTAGTLNGRQSSSSNQAGRPMNDSQFFENYQRLADMTQWLESLVEKNRDIGQIKVIGRSSQGRYLRVLKLGYDQQDLGDGPSYSAPTSDDSTAATSRNQQPPLQASNGTFILDTFFRKQAATKKLGSIWLDGGTHAREWISPSTVLYIAFRLSDNHNRCYHFFESLKTAASLSASGSGSVVEQQQQQQSRQAKRYSGSGSGSGSSGLDQNLMNGINEINTSLLNGKPVKQNRPRTEFEHTLELLAKSPQEVASEHGCDLDMDQLLRRYTFFIMPVLNPDGYEYSHTHNRLWRKTRSTSNHPIYRHFCLGADPNRNYDARHGATGSSTHPCSQTFAGSVPFTEPETRHHSNFVYANRLGMKMYISFHSYSQMILLPYSHSKQLAPDHKDLESVGLAAAKAIEQTHGTVYRVGASASILYTASGTASDWAYEKAGIKYSYTMELRDTGTYGFLLPRQQIIPTGEETFNGLLAMIQQMEKNDNLLTSKSSTSNNIFSSSLAISGQNSSSSSSSSQEKASSTTLDMNHVPDLENFGHGSWKNRNSRPQLESVLDGGWSHQHNNNNGLSGVRDRKQPATERPLGSGSGAGGDWPPSGELHSGDEEIVDTDNEPDAGYAFEGEGELMEPTSELNQLDSHLQSRSNRRILETNSIRMDDSRRAIARSSGLSSTGRNFINSPLLQQQDGSSQVRRRESSENVVGFGRATVA